MAQKLSQLATELWPFMLPKVSSMVSGGASGSSSGGVISDHGALTGLSDDDHPQYLTPGRGDLRYLTSARTLTAGDGLTGGGDLTADRTFAVGAGLGITVNADDIAVAATIAGNGLTYSSGVVNVGVSGLGLGVGADAVTLASSSNPGQAASILASGSNGELTLYNGFYTQGAQSAAAFNSGFAGSGWRADYGVTTAGKASIETDDLTVRGRMRVYELYIQQIRATNGSMFVSSGSKVVAITATQANPTWTVNGSQLTFNGSNANFVTTLYTISTAAATDTDGISNDRRLYHGFLVGDLIRAQQTRWNGSSFAGVIQSNMEVTSVANLYTYTGAFFGPDAPAAGYDFVRIGNASDVARRGSIYLTSDDSAAPFIDIVDGVYGHSIWNTPGAIKVRLGKLSGISDPAFGGALSGYGLYGNNVYLKGQIVVTGGSLGGLAAADVNSNTTTIDGGRITANTVTAAQINVTNLSALSANMGTLTAGSIVIGSTNKLWLNDSADGALNIGGATKASAPFQVTAAGALTATTATITGTIRAATGGVTGNWYVGYDVEYAGYLYAGTGGAMRFGSDGMRAVLPSTSAPNITTSSSAIRWFPNIGTTWTAAVNYAGLVAYRHSTGADAVDLTLTSYVGTADYTTKDARIVLQAGHDTNGSTYTDTRLEVVREMGSGLKYVAAYGDLFAVENKIQLTEASDPANAPTNQAYLFCKDNGSGKTQLCVKFATGASIVIATQA